ncbi:transforming acidic coiled-coil-containing protein 3-like [Physella acuta]|uniref:transforming acidic coiled-coil-containing protein 3-like n=1 Tax=Physella acuta TaxID=109671 RepID=UPI0027DB5FD9|nr:transforming acidic coiled-coil-containing protein 3-like [Physella acuta]
MDVTDENKPDHCSKLQVIHRTSSQSPLKPVNDDRRLSNTQGMSSSPAKKTPITSPYKCIRELDSAERWIERTSVVTKQDHMQNLENARLILLDIIGDLPVENLPNERMTSDEVSSKKEKDAVCQINRKEPPKILQEVDELADLLCGLDIAHGLSFTNSPSKAFDDNAALQFKNNACFDQVHTVSSESNTEFKMQSNENAENTVKQGIEMIENLIFDSSNTQTLYSPTNKHILVSELSDVEFMKTPSISTKKKLDTIQTEFQPLNSPTAEKLIPLSAVNDESVVETVVDTLEYKFQLPDSPTVKKTTQTSLDDELIVETVADPTDPFQTKFQLPNSPPVEKCNATPTKELKDDDKFTLKTATVSSDPFKTQFQLPNSPSADKPVSQATVGDELAVEKSTDPFKTKFHLPNSPSVEKEIQPTVDEFVKEKATDPFTTKFQLPNSPSVDKAVSQATVNDELAVEKSTDPFKTKFQLPNSPSVDKAVSQATVNDELAVEKSTDPFKTKFQLPNSPSVEKKIQPTVDEFVKEKATDPFTTKFQLPNSPSVDKAVSQATVNDELAVEKSTDPFKTKFQLPNSPSVDKAVSQATVNDELAVEKSTDPFKTKFQLPNSPSVEKKIQPTVDEFVKEKATDPFTTKFQLPNSPSVDKAVSQATVNDELAVEKSTDPFKTKFQLPNSPSVEKEVQPTVDEFVKEKATDPFTTKFQLPTSPSVDKAVSQATVGDELAVEKSTHPFKTKFQLPNSPSLDKQIQLAVDDEFLSEVTDPFKTKFQLPNSPSVEKEIQPTFEDFVVEKATDPFTTKFQLPNSPSVDKPVLQATVGDELAVEKSTDPFKTKSQLPNSSIDKAVSQPTDDDELAVEKSTDPFKTKFQLPNSPSVEKEIQPTVDEFVIETATDPFKTKSQLPNSPSVDKAVSQATVDDESVKPTNPFSGKAQLSNSPRLDSLKPFARNDKLQTENLVIAHTGLHETDQNKCLQDSTSGYNLLKEMNLNPVVASDAPHIKADSSSCGLVGQPCLNISKNKSVDFTNGVLESDLNTFKDFSIKDLSKEESQVIPHEQAAVEKTPVEDNLLTAESQVLNLEVKHANEDNTDFENDENFIPATEAFNNPEFFDMLEKSSNIKGPNSKRGSVLLKFDPLQERRESLLSKPLCSSPGPIHKPPRVSDVFKDSKALGLSFVDDSVCLFGTPPRVARRRTLTRRVYNNRVQSIEEESAANEVDMIFGIDEDCDGMDTIVHENLIPGSKGAVLVDVGEPCTYTESEVKRIRADLTMHFQELILKKDKEFQEKLKVQEDEANKEKAQLKADSDGLKNKVKNLQGKLRSLNEVMKEYTDIISQVTAEKKKVTAEQEKLTIELAELQKYNSQVLDDNKTLEKSFDDLFHRYEKLKQTLEKAAENEKILKQAVESAQEKFKSSKETAKKIKEMAETKIAEQEDKYEKLTTSTKSEITRLEAALKMKEMQIQGLESTLEQKRKENKELTDLCDSLINKVS